MVSLISPPAAGINPSYPKPMSHTPFVSFIPGNYRLAAAAAGEVRELCVAMRNTKQIVLFCLCFLLSITHGLAATYFHYPPNWYKPLFNSPHPNTNYVPPTPTTSPSSSTPAPESSPPPSPSSPSGGDQSPTPAPNPSPPSAGGPCPFPGGLPPLGDGDPAEAIPDMVYTVVKMAFQMVERGCGGCAAPNPSPPSNGSPPPPGGSPPTPTPSSDSPVTSPATSPSPDSPPTSPAPSPGPFTPPSTTPIPSSGSHKTKYCVCSCPDGPKIKVPLLPHGFCKCHVQCNDPSPPGRLLPNS